LNKLALFKAQLINSKGNCCQVKAPTKYNPTPFVAYILVPLWHKNDESITINLQLQPNGKQIGILTCQLKKGDAYIVCCKNHNNQKPKCKGNGVNCALHCKVHNLVMDSTQQERILNHLKENNLKNMTQDIFCSKTRCLNLLIILGMVCVFLQSVIFLRRSCSTRNIFST
jgi:hypothetical protein